MSTCPVCNGVGVIEVEEHANGQKKTVRRPCSAPNCLAGNLARIFQKKEKS